MDTHNAELQTSVDPSSGAALCGESSSHEQQPAGGTRHQQPAALHQISCSLDSHSPPLVRAATATIHGEQGADFSGHLLCSDTQLCSVCSVCSICSVCSVVQDRSRRDTRRDILVVIYTSGRAQTSSYFSHVVAGACACSVDNVCRRSRPVAMKAWEGYAGWWVGLPRIVGTRVLKYDQKLPPALAPPRTDAPTNSCQRKLSRRVRSIK